MDQDQSGSITCNELYKFIVKVTKMENGGEYQKVDREEVRAIFKNLDKDGDRSVEWEEFFVRYQTINYNFRFSWILNTLC